MTQKKGLSETKGMSPGCLRDTLLRKIYNGLDSIGAPVGSWERWYDEIIIYFKTDDGGIVFTRDKIGERMLWVHVYCPDKMPSLRRLRNMLLLASCTSASKVAAFVANPKIVSLLKRFGFQKQNNSVWILTFKQRR